MIKCSFVKTLAAITFNSKLFVNRFLFSFFLLQLFAQIKQILFLSIILYNRFTRNQMLKIFHQKHSLNSHPSRSISGEEGGDLVTEDLGSDNDEQEESADYVKGEEDGFE